MLPRIFIASASESTAYAHAIQENMDNRAECTVWDQDVFRLSAYSLDSLASALRLHDAAIFVFSPDDISIIRKTKYKIARDNVVFELGLFIGGLGRDRCFILMPRDTQDFHIPTDLVGIAAAFFAPSRSDGNLKAALAPACARIFRQITETTDQSVVTWSEYAKAVDTLVAMLCADPVSGGFRPQLIIGICRGGAVAADLISRKLSNVPMITLWADRDYSNDPRTVIYDSASNPFNRMHLATMLTTQHITRVLVVDDFCKQGASLEGALTWIRMQLRRQNTSRSYLKRLQIKTAVLARESAYDSIRRVKLDYCVLCDRLHLPYGRG